MLSPRASPRPSAATSPVQSLRHLQEEANPESVPKQEPAAPVIDPALSDPQEPASTPVNFSYHPSPFYLENRWHTPALTPAIFQSGRYPSLHETENMPHRVDSTDRSNSMSNHRSELSGSHPTPPPIAPLHHSPTGEHPSISSPSPPLPQHQYYQNPPPPPNGPGMHPGAYGYPYHSRYTDAGPIHHHQPPPSYPPATHYPPNPMPLSTRSIRPTFVPSQSYPGQPAYVVHTDDAATKLNDRVRRKCYNCRTTDTSTWRRSSLTPGKVLCNKCGLFERTHSRPRPEQFPHKRGPIVTTTFKPSRTPPTSSSRLPPIAAHGAPDQLPPHHYSHPSIAPPPRSDSQGSYTPNGSGALPEIRNLLNSPTSSSAQPLQSVAGSSGESNNLKRSRSPSSPHRSPRQEHRGPPYPYRSATS